MLSIKVLGPGCANCQNLEALVRRAASKMAIEARVEKVTRFPEMVKYRLLATPGLVINENLMCSGRVPSEAEVTTWLARAAVSEAS